MGTLVLIGCRDREACFEVVAKLSDRRCLGRIDAIWQFLEPVKLAACAGNVGKQFWAGHPLEVR